MSRSNDISPRMIIKVELKDKNKVNFELIMIDTKQLITKSKNYYYFSYKNDFIIHFTTVFDFEVNKYNKLINIPYKFIRNDNQNCDLTFQDDDERYLFIRDFKTTLIEWSNSTNWENDNTKNNISYNGTIWIVF